MNRLVMAGCALLLLTTAAFADSPASTDAGPGLETATFSMYCYWTGEATLGKVDGVVASRIGHWGGQEIVQVDFDPNKTNRSNLAQALIDQRSFYAVLADGERAAQRLASDFDGEQIRRVSGEAHFIEPKHSLRTRFPQLASLDLTEAQQIELNTWAYFGGPMPQVLTDEQKQLVQNR